VLAGGVGAGSRPAPFGPRPGRRHIWHVSCTPFWCAPRGGERSCGPPAACVLVTLALADRLLRTAQSV